MEISRRIEAAGASAVCVHGRTREQFYSGTADRDVIRQVKAAVKIPVIGNGDIFDVESCRSMFEETGCDLVMVARGALGNPWIFKSLCEGKDYIPSAEEKISIVKEHFTSVLEEKGAYAGVRIMRKHIGWYLKGMHGAAEMREKNQRDGGSGRDLCSTGPSSQPRSGRIERISESPLLQRRRKDRKKWQEMKCYLPRRVMTNWLQSMRNW